MMVTISFMIIFDNKYFDFYFKQIIRRIKIIPQNEQINHKTFHFISRVILINPLVDNNYQLPNRLSARYQSNICGFLSKLILRTNACPL